MAEAENRYIGFEVHIVVTMKTTVFLVVISCDLERA